MANDNATVATIVPITGRRLTLPAGPIFHLQRSDEADFQLGAFRAWAGYKDLGSEAATDGLILFQHVLSFGPTSASGRTGIHCHLAHVHIVIPTSGRGVFSYDGVVTEAAPGSVIVQHGGTVHDQFDYSYAAASAAENRATPVSVDPLPPGAPPQSFGFLELFLPATIANVEIVPPEAVTAADEASAWDHPYHTAGARYALQSASDPGAGWRPVAGQPAIDARDCETWAPSGALVSTLILRPARGVWGGETVSLATQGESGGLELIYMVAGEASFSTLEGTRFRMRAGDCLTCSAGVPGAPRDVSADMRCLRIFVSARAEHLRERTPAEIQRLEGMGPAIITRREVREAGDARPVNALHEETPLRDA